jgi:hypothetical protein
MVSLGDADELCRGKGRNFINLYYDYWSIGLWLMLEFARNIVFRFNNANSVMF